jgi:hypothetical protein
VVALASHLLKDPFDEGAGHVGGPTTTRPVRSVGEDVRLNRARWTLAERLAEAVS